MADFHQDLKKENKVKLNKGFEIVLQIGVLIGKAIQKRPELESEWEDVKAEIAEAKTPGSEGGTRVTFGEIFNEIAPELLDCARVISPTIDSLIELFDKDDED